MGKVENSKKTLPKTVKKRLLDAWATNNFEKALYVEEAFADQRPKQLKQNVGIQKQLK